VFAAVIGVIVSFLSWCFLELVHLVQVGVFEKLSDTLGFDSVPSWWAIPWLLLAGLVVAFAVVRLPGNDGHVPAEGLSMGSNEPNIVPGVALAALATLGLGAVLGPEAPPHRDGRGDRRCSSCGGSGRAHRRSSSSWAPPGASPRSR